MKFALNKNFLKGPDAQFLFALLPRLREKRVQSFTTLALTLITFSIFSVFAIAPTLGTITDLQKQISDNQFVSNQLQKKITTLSVLQDNYSRLTNQLPAVFSAIPVTPDIAMFLGQLQAIAAVSNVTVQRVQTLPVDFTTLSASTTFTSYSFAMDIEGSYDNVLLYLKNLTSFNRLVSISALSFGRNSRFTSIYRLSVRGSTYFQPK